VACRHRILHWARPTSNYVLKGLTFFSAYLGSNFFLLRLDANTLHRGVIKYSVSSLDHLTISPTFLCGSVFAAFLY